MQRIPYQFIDLAGKKFGRLSVLSRGPNAGRHPQWHCRCDCGKETLVHGRHIRSGITKSCGCLGRENVVKSNTKHGRCGQPIYQTWKAMIRRCYGVTGKDYPAYGGRGIFVCSEWRFSFSAFLEDMGERPQGTSLDRIDNDGPYSPDNCRWATPAQQCANKRNNVLVTRNGKTQTAAQWERELGFSRGTIRQRIRVSKYTGERLFSPRQNTGRASTHLSLPLTHSTNRQAGSINVK